MFALEEARFKLATDWGRQEGRKFGESVGYEMIDTLTMGVSILHRR